MGATNQRSHGLGLVWLLAMLGLVLIAVASSLAAAEPQANLLIVGDWGFSPPATQNAAQRKVAQAMAQYVRQSQIAFHGVLVVGDNFRTRLVGPDDPQFQEAFERVYDPKDLAMPFYAVFGAHDYEYGADRAELAYARAHPESRWKLPARWYRLDIPAAAPLVTVLMTDSDREWLGKDAWRAQLRWMEEELGKPRSSLWTICVSHHPLFSDGWHGDSLVLKAAWGPILKKHRVDFQISGHDHVLQHLELPGWTATFLTSGGGGEDTTRPLLGKRGPFIGAMHGFMVMQFTARTARVSLIDDTGNALHLFERDRDGKIRVIGPAPEGKSSAGASH